MSSLSEFFLPVDDTSKKCKLNNKFGTACNAVLLNRSFNMKRHLQRLHPREYQSLRSKDKVAKRTVEARQTTVTSSKHKFINYIIGSVVNHAIPITYFSGEVFKTFHAPLAASLGVSLDNWAIRCMIYERFEQVKSQIVRDVKNRGVHIKLDGCTRQGVQYFGLNVQYCNSNGTIVLKTLAVRSTHERHTANFVKRFINEILTEFSISPVQVLSIVTDNARNLICGVERLREEMDIEVVLDVEVDDEILGMVRTMTSGPITAVHMRCGAHTLQLAVNDGLNSLRLEPIIEKTRSLAIAVRKHVVHDVLVRYGTKLRAIRDVPTRWGSTYEMISRLMELKDSLQQIQSFVQVPILTTAEWEKLEALRVSLAPAYFLGKTLQLNNLTPGTFFSAWNSAKMDLETIQTELSLSIKTAMDQREKALFANNILLAGIYVDPNYRFSLSPQQQSVGRQTLLQVALHLQQLKEQTVVVEISEGDNSADMFDVTPTATSTPTQPQLEEQQQASASTSSTTSSPTTASPTTASSRTASPTTASSTTASSTTVLSGTTFEVFLDEQATDTSNRIQLMQQITLIETFQRSRVTILEILQKYPTDLKEAAEAVTAMPPTQVSVERLFSALKLIMSDLRGSTSPELLEKMLFLKVNGIEIVM